MANGLLGKAMAQANQNTTVAQVSANAAYATHNILLVHTNMDGTDAKVQIYLSTSTTPGPVDMIANKIIPPGGDLNISCELAAAGENFIVFSNNAEIAIRVTGLEAIPVAST